MDYRRQSDYALARIARKLASGMACISSMGSGDYDDQVYIIDILDEQVTIHVDRCVRPSWMARYGAGVRWKSTSQTKAKKVL